MSTSGGSNFLQYEMSQAELGDERLSRRIGRVVEAMSAKPSDTFPKIFRSEAFIESFYRILRNPRVSWREVLEAHVKASCDRAFRHEEVLVVHDTTTFQFKDGERREGLGWVHHQGQKKFGFFGHFALAVGTSGKRNPLGIVGFEPFRRLDEPTGETSGQRFKDPGKESRRWGELVEKVEGRLAAKTTPIHIVDSEGDSYELLSQLHNNGNHFIIRLCHDRRIKNPDSSYLFNSLKRFDHVCTREIRLSSRVKQNGLRKRKRNAERKSRLAQLGFSAGEVEIKRPLKGYRNSPKTLQLNVVHVFEIDPPADAHPVDWKIFTTEPVSTREEILRIVDFYRARWLIEDYFKALKTGCSYEKRLLESYETLLNALVLLIPVAWQLLQLRYLSRDSESEPAAQYFSQSQLRILQIKSNLDDNPTIRQVMLAVASLGGHMKSNGEPGWLVIGRGFYDLLMMELGYQIAKAERCDQ